MNKLNTLNKLKTEVFRKQAILAEVYAQHGQSSIFDYANSWNVAETSQAGEYGIFLDAAKSLLAETYDKKIASEVIGQLAKEPLVSTIDHHGLLNHPYFINSNLIFSLKKNTGFLICLTTAGVSLNNSSWPGCLVRTQGSELKRYSFFSDKSKTRAVLAAPSLGQGNIQAVLGKISQDGNLESGKKDLLAELVEELFLAEPALSLPSFSSQASALSTKLWERFFPNAPKVIYLPVEKLAAHLISHEICGNAGHILHKLLFTEPGWKLIEKYFHGSLGAFSSGHKGSFLFWGINSKGRRAHLHRQGNKLVYGDFSVELNPTAINQALADIRIYPTSLVCFLILLYYQVTCLGGFNQVNWLTTIKEKFTALLWEMGESGCLDRIAATETKNFAEGNLAFLFQKDRLVKAAGVDILLEKNHQLYQKYQYLALQMTVGESVESLLPEIYRVITPASERDNKFLSVTDEDVAKSNGLEEKIRSALQG